MREGAPRGAPHDLKRENDVSRKDDIDATLKFAKEGAELFVQKCRDGRARSKVTYAWCVELLERIKKIEEK
jgi:hypothetical protein